MAQLIGIRSLHRRGIRIGGTLVKPDETTEVDVDDAKVRRDLQRHSAIGAVVVVEAKGDLEARVTDLETP
jgi:hypothetical protein